MRVTQFLLLILFITPAASQELDITVLDSVTTQPLELATVRFLNSDYTIFTSSKGIFKRVPEEDFAEITHIGYAPKKINLNNNQVILLEPEVTQLPEVVLEFKKHLYSKKATLKAGSVDEYFGFQFGTEHCTYIQNKYRKPGKISSVTLYLSKMKDFNFIDKALGKDKNCKGCKMDYVASYKLTFYEYDKTTGKPGRELADKEVIVHPENKTQKFKIDVDSLNIPLPENGICIGVEVINTRYIKPKSTFAFIGPFLGFHYEAASRAVSWVRYRGEGWTFREATTNKIKGKNYKALTIDVGIKI